MAAVAQTSGKELSTLDQETANLQAINAILFRWNLSTVKAPDGRLTIPETATVLFNSRNLRLTQVKGKLHEVVNANIPFLLETRIAGSQGKYCLAITSVSADAATISPPLADRSSITLTELETLSNGTYYLVWDNFHQIPDKISVGNRRYEIRALQQLLKSAGAYTGPIDGIFGSASLDAVHTFQQKNSIPTNDTVGAQTVAYLYRFDKSGRSPNLKNY
jgi:hypothetical protein